jgi:hypothetical protein
VVITVLVAPLVTLASVTTAYAEATLPSGFEDLVSVGGLHQPTNVEFFQDSRIFVDEKSDPITALSSSMTSPRTSNRRSVPTCAPRCTTIETAMCQV